MYTSQVKDHFINPHNFGEIPNPDGTSEVGNMKCGDIMKLDIKVDPQNQKITDCKFKTFGCAAAIATSSVTTDLAIGKTIEEAEKIVNEDVLKELGTLPPLKIHCSLLAVDALKRAIQDYKQKQKK